MKTGYPSIDKTHLKGISYFKRNPLIPNLSVSNAFDLVSLGYRNEEAVDCLDLHIKYKDLIKDSSILARAFMELGIKKGDIISICMPNIYQAVVSYFALNKIGAVTTFLNSFSAKEEIVHHLNEFSSPIFINYDKNQEYNNYIKKNTKVKQIITLKKENLNNNIFNNEKISSYNDYKLW